MSHELPETSGYGRIPILISAVVGVVVGLGSVWLTVFLLSGTGAGGTFYETLFRVGPTVQGGGVGADWTTGNTIPALDFLIALVHAADVILGVFILVLVFIHWAAFRRLASRMRRPEDADRSEAVATDGGREATNSAVTSNNEDLESSSDVDADTVVDRTPEGNGGDR